MNGVDWGQVALFLGVLVPSVILHEVAHGWAAYRLGDDTAKRRGRLTLNPLAHIDPIGTVLLPLVLAIAGVGVIGYAKPVPVNTRRLRRPRDHAVVVALAGPAVNVGLAVAAALAVRSLGDVGSIEFDEGPLGSIDLVYVASAVGIINVLLALFNLLPIPPLDGSAVVERVLPRRWLPGWARLRRWSILVVLVAIVVFDIGEYVLDPAFELWELLA